MSDDIQSPSAISLGAMLRRSVVVGERHWIVLLTALLGFGAFGTIIDRITADSTNSAGNLVGFFVEAVIVTTMLRGEVRDGDAVANRYVRLFGNSLLAGLGIIAGLILLVVPGLVLIARWTLAWPLILHRNMGAAEALGASWRLTRGATGSMMALVLLPYALGIAALLIIVAVSMSGAADKNGLFADLLSNMILSAMMMSSCVVTVAAYTMFERSAEKLDGLQEVFS